MCGIAGWLGKRDVIANDCAEAVLKTLSHRGPDASGKKIWDQATLLHARLSIIDLSARGAQPMSNEDGTIWTVFNGEIYNHHELRAELERKGHVFRGRSDTEVIPSLYEEMGSQFVEQLRGMFTIAIYDTRSNQLLLARDRFGIKPLFYAPQPNFLAFASEIRALTLLPGIDLTPDAQAIYDYAALFYIPAPETFYSGIRALQPGEIIEANLSEGRLSYRSRFFHQWEITPNFELTVESAADRAEEIIQPAVKKQLESDVPLGSMLSGGIDSSLVSLYAQNALQHPLLTFSVRMSEPEYDETWAAQAVAEVIGSHHTVLNMPESQGSWNYITSLLLHIGQPYADTSVFAVDQVSKLMRQHVTVALSGDGGDEGFGGYDLYNRAPQFASMLRIPYGIRKPALLALAALATPVSRLGKLKHHFPYLVRDLANASDQTSLVQKLFLWIREDEHRALVRDHNNQPIRRLFEQQWKVNLPQSAPLVERISAQMTEVNTRLTLTSDYLFKTDIASMHNSLEVRVPILDEDLFAFGLSLPHQLKMKNHTGKQVLRAVANRRLPQKVVNKPKWGFGIPVDKWVTQDFKSNLQQTLLSSRTPLADYLHPNVYRPMIEAFCSERIHPSISRMGLYQRAIMLLSLHLYLAGETS